MVRRASYFFLLVSLSIHLLVSGQTPPSDRFVLIALPDTQNYTASYPQIFIFNMQWVAANASAMNIKFVAGLGDIVNDVGVAAEWQNADTAVKELDAAGIPYGMAIGNHDYDTGPMDDSNRQATAFNAWFGPTRYSSYPWYGSTTYPVGGNENFYETLSINGVSYLFLFLEIYPRDAALNWATALLQANPDKRVVVVTHGYENSDNYRMGKCDISGPVTYNLANDNDGDMMWGKFVSQFPNIFLVLSGHMTYVGREADAGVNGNLVNQLMSGHFTNDPNGGNGYLRIYTITPSQNRIDVQTYSPYANLFKTDSANQFSMSMSGSPLGTQTGQASIRGRIRSSACAALAGATVKCTSTGSGASTSVSTGSTGYYSVPVSSPDSLTVTASANGYYSASTTVSVLDGFQVPARFVLAPLPPDFTLSNSPTSQTVSQGATADFSTSSAALYGFAGTVSLAITGLPGNATASFSPATVTGAGTVSLEIVTDLQTPVGSYPLTVSGTSGSLQHSVALTLVVKAAVPDFSMSLAPALQSVVQGSAATFSVGLTPINGFSDTVNLSLAGLPSGAAATFAPVAIVSSGVSSLTVSTSSTTPAGSYTLVITGTDAANSAQHSVQATLSVTAAPDYSFSVSPVSQSVATGTTAKFTGTVGALNGFTGTVTFSITGLPAGASATFSPASIVGAGATSITIGTTTSTPTGSYPLTIVANSGILLHGATTTLSVTSAPDFSIALSPSGQTLPQNSHTVFMLTITPLNGFTGTATFALSGLSSGLSAKFTPNSLTTSGSSTLTISSLGTATPGNYTPQVTVTSGALQHSVNVSVSVTGFDLALSPSSLTVKRGSSSTFKATISMLNGYSGTMTFSSLSLPTGVTTLFSPTSVSSSGSSTVTVKAVSTTKVGSYKISIRATNRSTGLYRTETLTLVVQ